MTGSTEEGVPHHGTIRLSVEPESNYYAASDQRTAEELFELQRALVSELPDGIQRRPAPGEKGIITEIVVPLATGGAFSAMAEIFKAWLAKRPTNRRIRLSYEINRGEHESSGTLDLEATNVDDAVLGKIAKEAFESGGT